MKFKENRFGRFYVSGQFLAEDYHYVFLKLFEDMIIIQAIYERDRERMMYVGHHKSFDILPSITGNIPEYTAIISRTTPTGLQDNPRDDFSVSFVKTPTNEVAQEFQLSEPKVDTLKRVFL